ncbi:MAG: cell division protein FtsA [Bacteroidetes bacterium]|nr:cell division protein FtsA [Bacteroidota bacterium]
MQTVKENPIVVGLDIGTTKIAAIVGQQDQYGKIKVLGIGRADSQGVARGEVVNIEMTVNAIKDAVAQAEQQSGVEIRSVYVGIAGEHISSKQNRDIYTLADQDTEVSDTDIKAMIQNMHRLALEPGERIIHVLPQEFFIDGNPVAKTPIGMCGSRLEANFHIITGKVAAAQNIKKCVERSGLQMIGLILEPLASSASVLSEEEMEAGVCLVDIGGGTTDIAIFQDNIIRHTAVIPFAGNIITEDIKTGCMVLKKQAEKLKVRFGSALPQENQENEIISIPGINGRERKEISMQMLAKIINARMEEIVQQVYFEIRSSGYANKLIGGVVITGGGSQLKHLKQLVEYHTGLSARIGLPTEYLAKDTKDDLKNPMYSTAIGLIIEGIKELEDQQRGNNKRRAEILAKEKEMAEAALLAEAAAAAAAATATVEVQEEVKPQVHFEMQPEPEPMKKVKKDSWVKGLLTNVKDWFEDESVNNDFQ